MQKSPLDPDIADLASAGPALTAYDDEHMITYFRVLDADAEGADWREVSRIVLHIDASGRRLTQHVRAFRFFAQRKTAARFHRSFSATLAKPLPKAVLGFAKKLGAPNGQCRGI